MDTLTEARTSCLHSLDVLGRLFRVSHCAWRKAFNSAALLHGATVRKTHCFDVSESYEASARYCRTLDVEVLGMVPVLDHIRYLCNPIKKYFFIVTYASLLSET